MYDPKQVDYKQLLQVFLDNHDPTSMNKQGGDKGTQYRSAIYFHASEQRRIAQQVLADAASSYAVSSCNSHAQTLHYRSVLTQHS